MKRISSEEKIKHKIYSERKYRHESKRRVIRLKKRYFRSLQQIKIKAKKDKVRAFIKDYRKVEHTLCTAEESFSILEQTEPVINYFNKAIESFNNGIPVVFDINMVKYIDAATLTYLCALVNDKRIVKGIPLQGNLPKVPELREMFIQSGFAKFVQSNFNNLNPTDKYGELLNETKIRVENEIAKKVCLSALKHTYGFAEIKRNDIFEIIIECMANTHNHANFGNKEATYNWWLFAYKDSKTRITKFCFLDIGIGIFKSLQFKFLNSSLPEHLYNVFIPDRNIETLKSIFSGVPKTSTKKNERGKGIKNIYNKVKNNPKIANFTLISNDVKAKVSYNGEDSIVKIQKNFNGTLYYWELIPNEKN